MDAIQVAPPFLVVEVPLVREVGELGLPAVRQPLCTKALRFRIRLAVQLLQVLVQIII